MEKNDKYDPAVKSRSDDLEPMDANPYMYELYPDEESRSTLRRSKYMTALATSTSWAKSRLGRPTSSSRARTWKDVDVVSVRAASGELAKSALRDGVLIYGVA